MDLQLLRELKPSALQLIGVYVFMSDYKQAWINAYASYLPAKLNLLSFSCNNGGDFAGALDYSYFGR